ncbi:hypothetical protein R1N70_25485, partial [Klebsiella sp. 102123]|uniref:hypothetical protein n=1 Tax=Klebsiella TaxID=570 RepID=UPI00223F521E
VGHLFMFLVGGKTPDQSVHLNLTTTPSGSRAGARLAASINLLKRDAYYQRWRVWQWNAYYR